MIANLSDIIKIPAAVLAGIVLAVLFYEGLRLPFIGQIVPGIVYFRVTAATENMVTRFERDALAAQIEQEKRERLAAQQAATDAKKRAEATQRAKDEADARIAALEADARKANLPGWSEEELRWLDQH